MNLSTNLFRTVVRESGNQAAEADHIPALRFPLSVKQYLNADTRHFKFKQYANDELNLEQVIQ